MELRDRVVLLTGASRGIGTAIATALAREGANLVLTARDAAALESVAEDVRAAGGRATVVPADVATEAGRAAMLAVGAVDVLVCNAGVEHPVAVVDQSPSQIEQQVVVNLLAPMLLTRAVLPGMIERGRGAVVLVSSMSGKSPTPYNAIYAGTKFGMNGFAASTRLELEGTGVTIGVVCPGFVADEGMWASSGVRAPALMREVSLDSVVAGVRRAIDGAAEVLVTRSPVRPLLALSQLLPGIDGPLLRAIGVTEALKQRAERARDH